MTQLFYRTYVSGGSNLVLNLRPGVTNREVYEMLKSKTINGHHMHDLKVIDRGNVSLSQALVDGPKGDDLYPVDELSKHAMAGVLVFSNPEISRTKPHSSSSSGSPSPYMGSKSPSPTRVPSSYSSKPSSPVSPRSPTRTERKLHVKTLGLGTHHITFDHPASYADVHAKLVDMGFLHPLLFLGNEEVIGDASANDPDMFPFGIYADKTLTLISRDLSPKLESSTQAMELRTALDNLERVRKLMSDLKIEEAVIMGQIQRLNNVEMVDGQQVPSSPKSPTRRSSRSPPVASSSYMRSRASKYSPGGEQYLDEDM